MSWSYSLDNMSAPLNYIRLKVGDTDTNDQKLMDEEINCILMLVPNLNVAASTAALAIAAHYANVHDVTKTGPMLVHDLNLYNHYIDLSKQIMADVKSTSTFAGMIKPTHGSIFDIGMQDDIQLEGIATRTSNSLDGSLDDL